MSIRGTLAAWAIGGLIVSGLVAPASAADPTVSITTLTGVWSNITGNPTSLAGDGTNKFSWGDPATSAGKSSFAFAGNAPAGPYAQGVNFTLGTFTFNNTSVYGDPPTSAKLTLSINGVISNGGASQSFSITPAYTFTLDSTPNIPTRTDPNCCADIVVAADNKGGSQNINFQGMAYTFSFSAFQSNGQTFTSFSVPEKSSASASVLGKLSPVATPGPIAGAGLVPIFGLAGAWFVRRRKQKLTT